MSRRPAATSALATRGQASRLEQVLAAGIANLKVSEEKDGKDGKEEEKREEEPTDVQPFFRQVSPGEYEVTPTIGRRWILADGSPSPDYPRYRNLLTYLYKGKPIEFQGGQRTVPINDGTAETLGALIKPQTFESMVNAQGAYPGPQLRPRMLPDFVYVNTVAPAQQAPMQIGWTPNALGGITRGRFWWNAVKIVDGANLFFDGGSRIPSASEVKMQAVPANMPTGRKPQLVFIKEEAWRDNLLDPNNGVGGRLRGTPYPYGEQIPAMSAAMANHFAVQLPHVDDPVCRKIGFNLVVVVVGLRPCARDQTGRYVTGVEGATSCYRKRPDPQGPDANGRRRPDQCALAGPDGQPITDWDHKWCEFDDYLASEMVYFIRNRCSHESGSFQGETPNAQGSRIDLQSGDRNLLKEEWDIAAYNEKVYRVAGGMNVRAYRFNIPPLMNQLDERDPRVKQRERPGEEPQSSRDGAQQGGGKRRA